MAEMTQLADVVSRLGRSLAPDERELADTLISDAENRIRIRLPDRMLNGDTADEDIVRQVVGSAVVRVLRNPDGYRSESAGGVSYQIDTRAASGFLTILSEEWRMLGLSPEGRSGAFSVAPTLECPPVTRGWSPWL